MIFEDFDEYPAEGTHWHAYIYLLGLREKVTETRHERLARTPNKVLTSPTMAGDWFADLHERYVSDDRCEEVGDETHSSKVWFDVAEAASREDTIHYDFHGGQDTRIHIRAEVMRLADCSDIHAEQSLAGTVILEKENRNGQGQR